MEANELRIGNLVDYHSNYSPVIALDSDRVNEYLKTSVRVGENATWLNHIKPIPLTEYWLQKFELQESGLSSIHSKRYNLTYDGRFTIHLGEALEHEVLFEGNGMVYLKYVHQLQNLFFALTDEELTIK